MHHHPIIGLLFAEGLVLLIALNAWWLGRHNPG